MGELSEGRGGQGYRHPPRSKGGRDWIQPEIPCRSLFRQCNHGDPDHRGRTPGRCREVRCPRHCLRVSQVHARPVPRRESLERLSRGDKRPLRACKENAPCPVPGIPAAVRVQRHLPPPREPVRSAGQLQPREFPRHPCTDKEVHGRRTHQGESRRGLGNGKRVPRVPVRRRCGPGNRACNRAIQQA